MLMPTDTPQGVLACRANAPAVLARHGKSFHWAGRFLARRALQDAATLYAFCRLVDDAVDAAVTIDEARSAIEVIRASLQARKQAAGAVAEFRELADRHKIARQLPLALVDGVASDLDTVRVQSRRDLLRYCYRVAGTVGAMMCPLLDVKDARALPFAVDLGIATQLTNIARDVLEDARRDRLYLPAQELKSVVTCEGLVRGAEVERAAATAVVLDLLNLAETYYQSADRGLRYIPVKNRLAVLVAGRIYRAIGLKIMKAPSRIWHGRTVVPRTVKVRRTVGAIMELGVKPSLSGLGPVRRHENELHTPLAGLIPS